MAKFEVDLRDSGGTPVEFGDTIRVVLPEVINGIFDPGSESYGSVEERVVEGQLKFWLSKGLVFKVTRIIKNDGDDLKIGQIIPLRRRIWDWWKIT